MKQTLFLLLFCLSFSSMFAQKKKDIEKAQQIDLIVDSLSNYYTITEEGVLISKVIQAPNLNKGELYVRLLEILSSTYSNSKNLIQVQDKEQGFILGKGRDTNTVPDIFGLSQVNTVYHTIKVEVKDYRFKVSVTLTNVDREGYNGNRKSWEYKNSILDFYPFSDKIKLKYVDDSFNTIKFSITNAISLIDSFEDKVSKIEIEEW
jgi:hypothetical protein